ncbi:MAG: DUF2760 domain-containing protein [Desulfotignum sp.]
MEISKQFQRRSFWIISCFMLVIAAGMGGGFFYTLDRAGRMVATDAGKDLLMDSLVPAIVLMQDEFLVWVLPAAAVVLLLLGWILWLLLRAAMVPVFRKMTDSGRSKPAPGTSGKKDFLDQKIEQERKQRLFLHTLSVLQREGRLLDFFDEDLKQYSDEQIGAAVRSIQQDCKQAVKKYIDPRPVVNATEGEPFTVAPGFDMNAITLVGNVTGEPPFEGIVKHPGWKAGKKEIPRLADIRDAAVITPAEIEIRTDR